MVLFLSDLSVKNEGFIRFFHYESRVDLTPFMSGSEFFDFSSLFSLCVYLLMFFLIFSYLIFLHLFLWTSVSSFIAELNVIQYCLLNLPGLQGIV